MHRILTFGLITAFCAVGACSTAFKPEPIHPSAERMQQLLDAPVPSHKPSKPLPLSASVYPPIPMPRSEARFTCRLPVNVTDGKVFFGVEGVFNSEGPIDRVEYLRIVQVGCEPLQIYCGYQEYNGETGWQIPVRVDEEVKLAGDCEK